MGPSDRRRSRGCAGRGTRRPEKPRASGPTRSMPKPRSSSPAAPAATPAPQAWADGVRPARERVRRSSRGGRVAGAADPSPVLARLLGRRDTDGRGPFGRATRPRGWRELAIAAASLGELTISAMGTATVLGNAQLAAAGTRPPRHRPVQSRPRARGRHSAGTGAGAGDARRRGRDRRRAASRRSAEKPPPTLEELLAELDAAGRPRRGEDRDPPPDPGAAHPGAAGRGGLEDSRT